MSPRRMASNAVSPFSRKGAGVTGTSGGSRSSGMSSEASVIRSPSSSSGPTASMSFSLSAASGAMRSSRSSSIRSARVTSGISSCTSSLTTSPKRRRKTCSSMAWSRSSGSSVSASSMSELRVIRNAYQLRISIPGKSALRLAPITCSSGTNWCGRPNETHRGRLFGTFTRAKWSSPVSGSRTSTASESERLEMYGNGCPGSTASGVRTGNTCDSK